MRTLAPQSTREHTRWQAWIFQMKAAVLRARRSWQNHLRPLQKFTAVPSPAVDLPLLAQSRSDLWTRGNAHERRLQMGKVENLRLAVRSIHGIVVPAGAVFSFWQQVGRPSARRGFAPGRELREGCLIPSIGGGLCQLSNALDDCAWQAGVEIVERHAHTQVVPGSQAVLGRDATVFWNYVDLRLRPREDLHIEATLDVDQLTVRFSGCGPDDARADEHAPDPRRATGVPASCASCGLADCFRHLERQAVPAETAAILVDEYWPEFDEWLQALPGWKRTLFLPLRGRGLGLARYGWRTTGFHQVHQFPFFAARRSLLSRKLATQGAARQRALLAQDERLAALFARRLTFEMTHLIVAQNLLPFLWKSGALGGRTFDVLLTRWPLAVLQQKLDAAALRYPESRTLGDFRVDAALARAEQAALAAASLVITPHSLLAAMFGSRAVRLPWKMSPPRAISRGQQLVFPASSLGRKGIHVLREALRRKPGQLKVAGPVLEDGEFWQGLPVQRLEGDWLSQAGCVVLPSLLENQPRRLLEAIAQGIPVIATPECGLEGLPGVTIVPAGDVEALAAALGRHQWQPGLAETGAREVPG